MKKQMIGIFVFILLIATVIPVSGNNNLNKNEQDIQNLIDKQGFTFTNGDDVDWRSQYQNDPQSYRYSTNEKKNFGSVFHPRQLIVKFKEETKVSISSSSNNFVVTSVSSIDILNEKYKVISAEELFKEFTLSGLSSIYKLIFSDDVDIYRMMKEYSMDPSIEYAEPNYIKHQSSTHFNSDATILIPDDPLFDEQWALNRSDDCDIDAPEAWYIETGSSDVVIAIIDSGVDYNHEDLAGNIWNNTDEIPDNGIDDDNNGFIDDVRGWDFVDNDNDPNDDNGHGTYCSGIAAAVTNNSIGIAGVSWNCIIMPIDASKGGIAYEDDIAHSIYYAVDNDADIISMSWGAYSPGKLEYEAVAYAYDHGVVLVAAAGNQNTDIQSFPAAYDQVIAVAATNNSDQRAIEWNWASNYGSWIDVAAPGCGILTTNKGNSYAKIYGTSMSCPHVAGLAALLLSKHSQCPYPAQMVKSVTRYTTDEIETDEYIGTGRINAFNALTQEPFALELETISQWEDAKGTINIEGTIWGDYLQYFTLYLGQGENPNSWTELLNSSTSQSGVLLSLDTTSLDEGLHTLKLQAVYTHGVFTEEKVMYINNEADGSYDADIFVSNCFDSSTPGWGVTRFDNIQEGIDASKKGDTVFVYDGIYPEDIEIIGRFLGLKTINLIGQNKNWTIIEGCINISYAKKTSVSGFTVRGGTGFSVFGPYEISLLFSFQCKVANCNIVNPYFDAPTFRIDFSLNTDISNNNISTSWYGHRRSAIMHFVSSKSEISGNTLLNHGIGIGMILGRSNTIFNNTFKEVMDCNLYSFACNNFIYKNTMIDCDFGVDLWEGCFRNVIVGNTIINTEGMGFLGVVGQGGNHIYLNNFINSWVNDDSINHWYKPEGLFHGKGNYYSLYEWWYKEEYSEDPKDEDNDGIWDKPFKIDTGLLEFFAGIKHLNRDRFPFVDPVDIENITVTYGFSEVTIPKNNQASNMWFLWLLERFPILQKLLFSLLNKTLESRLRF